MEHFVFIIAYDRVLLGLLSYMIVKKPYLEAHG